MRFPLALVVIVGASCLATSDGFAGIDPSRRRRRDASDGVSARRNDPSEIPIAPEERSEAVAAVAEGAWRFARDLYQNVAVRTPDSFAASPLSLSFALGTASRGARKDTRRNLLGLVGLEDAAPSTVEFGYRWLIEEIAGSADETSPVRLENEAGTLDGHVQPSDAFLERARLGFNASRYWLDPSYAKYKRSSLMERWIGAQRADATRDIVGYTRLTFDPMLVLENSIHAPGKWDIPFDDARTEMRPFWYKGQASIKVPTMYARRILRHGQLPELKATFVRLPYESGSSEHAPSMYVLLPDETDGLAYLEQNLGKLEPSAFLENAGDERMIDLYLPKFRLENYLWLSETLKAMGLADAFTGAANFDDLSETGYFLVRGVGQAALLDASTHGANLGTTLESMVPAQPHREPPSEYFESVAGPPIPFAADRPFVALVATGGRNPVVVSIGRFVGH